MRNKLKLWMLPIILVASFMLTTCVVAAFSSQEQPTQCMYGTIYEARERIGDQFVMQVRIMVYRDQEAEPGWAFPDAFICTRR